MEKKEQKEKIAEIRIIGSTPDIATFLNCFSRTQSLIEAEKLSGVHVRFQD